MGKFLMLRDTICDNYFYEEGDEEYLQKHVSY